MKTLTLDLEDEVNKDWDRLTDAVLIRVANLYNVTFEEVKKIKPKEIVIDPLGEHNGYDGECNHFYVSNIDLLKDIGFWAEELAHVVRNYCVKYSSGDVQEFFGGLARLVIGEEKDITLADDKVMIEKLKANNKILTASVAKCQTILGRAFDKKPGESILNDIKEEEKVLGLIRASYMDNILTKENSGFAYDLINMSKLSESRKRELKGLIVQPDGLSGVIEEAEEFRNDIENMHDDIETRDTCDEAMIMLYDAKKEAAKNHKHSIDAHKAGYNDMAQELYDSNAYVSLLEHYPTLIQLSDKAVRKLVNFYIKNPYGGFFQRHKVKGAAK